ncbi:MAG TPA: hypothetical protein PKM36_06685 [Propionibacteriaceae bacterium]|nr:hypothetical protein [Propionibacteriaceae bacterium]
MTQNIPLGVVLVVVGSFCFAASAYLQHDAVGTQLDGNREKKRMRLRTLLAATRRPRWVMGLALLGTSFFLQVIALTMAPVSVVQPVGLLAFPWSVLLAARGAHTRVPTPMKAAVAVTVLATLGFGIVTGLHAARESDLDLSRVFFGAGIVYVVAFVFSRMGSRGPVEWRCLFWSSAGALFYGLEAALVKSVIEFVRMPKWYTNVGLVAIAGMLLVGALVAGWLIQQGYATGPSEIVVGSMTVTSPVVAVAYGIGVLGEGLRITVPAAVLMAVLGAIAIAGVVLLTRFHPDRREPELPGWSEPGEATFDSPPASQG